MDNVTNVKEKLAGLTDQAYKLAFILTLSEEGAEQTVVAAAARLCRAKADGDIKELFFKAVCAEAKNVRTEPMTAERITERFGVKSDDFYEFIKLPARQRAVLHLTEYENMTAEQAERIAGK